MGTSTHNPGQKGSTPLVPSWLDDENSEKSSIPQIADPERFKVPRGDFTRYINSGGRNSATMKRATSNYVRQSLGGSRNATIRLGTARQSTAKLFDLVNSFSRSGISNTEKQYALGNLIGKQADEVFRNIVDFVCPDGGTTDEGIARSSYIETIIDMPELGEVKIEDMGINQFSVFLKTYMSNVIMERLLNDIGNKSIVLPDDIDTVNYIQGQVKEYIDGAVSDSFAMLELESKLGKISTTQTQGITDSVYERAYSILEGMGENE